MTLEWYCLHYGSSHQLTFVSSVCLLYSDGSLRVSRAVELLQNYCFCWQRSTLEDDIRISPRMANENISEFIFTNQILIVYGSERHTYKTSTQE